MQERMLYRNPSTDLMEVKEFSSKAPYRQWVKDANGVIVLKEFAADTQLGLLRVADPVLTNIAQGYQPQEGMIGDILFPSVKVAKESGRFPAFGKEMRVLPGGDIKRAVGGLVQRMITQTGYIQLSLSEYALGFNVENREINEWAGNSSQLLVARQTTLTEKIRLYREYLQMVLATTVASYATNFALSGASKAWATTGDPIKDMLQSIALVRKTNGKNPDVVWFTPTAWYLFCNNTIVKNTIKYGGTESAPAQLYVGGESAVARLLGVKQVVVAWASYTTGTDGGFLQAAGTDAWLWESVNSACAGCAITGLGWGVPSFGYTYERLNSPIVESWYDNSVKSMKYDSEHFFDPAVTKTDGGAMYYALA
jgi:hypothetical protein